MKQNYYRQQRGSAGATSNIVPPLQIKRQQSTNKIAAQPSMGSHLREIMKQQFVPTTSTNNIQNEIIRSQETYLQEVPVELQDIKMYQILNVLGHGATAEVKMARHKMLDFVVAIKIYGSNANIQLLEQEVLILQLLSHPNIIKLYYQLKTTQSIYLIQEYFSPMTLDTYLKGRTIKRLSEDQAKIIGKQLRNAITYLHSLNIIHRDLKLENILIDPSTLKIKLIDFGYSIQTDKELSIQCGTHQYMAPELIKQQNYDNKVDVWACGVILFRLLTGLFPFKGNNDAELNKKIIAGKLEFPSFMNGSSKTLLQGMLNVNSQQRTLIGSDFLQ
ncbi:unnamed protein product (macronuclear) [Paramecium tetraurelia]|uniref:Protein kinase domain-containing protein n=1 Tax=Paramecium tetraurelia TaxID=5888 RepID=A0BTX5_PARTE|nr:uncharacterized protein GSPATT00032224001 [Paramecium tetraurelia]CAK61992.1 unnamed protein product [Paramecium tetraurelia]|eukprot:XP_001429390.1 hypothetical protein (macronuclear) [Paramecium tetraurelia strain d4-2]